MSPFRIAVLTIVVLAAFASNSILCRLALRDGQIDPASFTSIRLGSGALALWLLFSLHSREQRAGSLVSGLLLALYAVGFSFAYVSLETGVGALILFGAVQATMIAYGMFHGERPGIREWAGLLLALGGLIFLVSPGMTAPNPIGAALMAVAGIAWGGYSLRGRGIANPSLATAQNFLWSVPFAVIVSAVFISKIEITNVGAIYAVISGVMTSGLGYVLWYTVQPSLTATRAAIVQLSVPILTAFGGVLVLSEHVTTRLVIASIATLGGVFLAVIFRQSPPTEFRRRTHERKTQ